jgi:hypothetical protein
MNNSDNERDSDANDVQLTSDSDSPPIAQRSESSLSSTKKKSTKLDGTFQRKWLIQKEFRGIRNIFYMAFTNFVFCWKSARVAQFANKYTHIFSYISNHHP